MSTMKNYGIAGVASAVQYGKKGGVLRYINNASDGAGGTAPAFQLRDVSNAVLMRVQGGAPVHNDDLTTKLYVDSIVQGLDFKQSVRVASTANVPLTGTAPLVVDTITLSNGDRVLLKDQSDPRINGLYVLTVSGGNYTLTRATDADNLNNAGVASSEVSGGMFVFVEEGGASADTGWVLSSPNGKANLGTDSLAFTQFSSAGNITAGKALVKTGSVLDVNTDDSTIYTDVNNKLAVKSSATSGQVLISNGSGSATWGNISLSSGAFGSSVLNPANGGTGFGTYTPGDVLVGDANNTLSKISKGANSTVFGVDSTGVQGYRYIGHLRDSSGNLLLSNTSVASATNYFSINNSTGTGDLVLSTAGSGTDLNIQLAPKGNGVITAKAGYNAWLAANRSTVSDDALVTKGLLDSRIAGVDSSRIQNTAGDTFFATAQSGYANKGVVASNNKVVTEFVGATAAGVATAGERMQVTHVTDEVRVGAINSAGTGNVNLRLIPQAQGQVFIGTTGAGLIQAEDGYQLTVKGGNNTGTQDAGNLVLRGGDATAGNFNAGNVRIFAGTNSGTGTRGTVRIEDDRQAIIADFRSPTAPAANWFEFENSVNDTDPLTSSLKIRAALASATSDISILLDPKGNGLVRVADASTYLGALNQTGQLDALVTKGFVQGLVSGNTRTPGVGLSQDDTTTNVNVGATTIKVDGTNNLIVNSSAVANQVMLSKGSLGVEATFGALPLGNSNSVSGALGSANGGTGITSYTAGDILAAGTGGTLTKIAKGANSTVFGIDSTGTQGYRYIGHLRDANGAIAAQANGVTNAVNFATFTNAAASGAVTIGSDGTDTNISMVLNPKGTGLVFARSGYTANIGSNRETFVTKGYVDDNVQNNTDPLVRRAAISSGWLSSMPVGAVTPNVTGRTVYLSRAILNVITPVSGGNAVNARITAGGTEVMSINENDITDANTYIADLPYGFSSTNSQLSVEFYQVDGVTPATPTAGSIVVSVEYRIV